METTAVLNRSTLKTLRLLADEVRRNDTERSLCMFDEQQVDAIQELLRHLPDVIDLCDIALKSPDELASPYEHPMSKYFDKTHQQYGSDGHFPVGSTSGNSLELREMESPHPRGPDNTQWGACEG